MDLLHPLSRTSAPPKVGLGPASRDSIGHVIGGTGRFQETIIGVNLLTSDLSVLCGNMRAIRGWPATPFTWRTRRSFRPPSHDPALQDRDLSRFSRGRLSPGESRAFSIRRRVDRGRRHRIETPACRRRGNGRHSLEGPLWGGDRPRAGPGRRVYTSGGRGNRPGAAGTPPAGRRPGCRLDLRIRPGSRAGGNLPVRPEENRTLRELLPPGNAVPDRGHSAPRDRSRHRRPRSPSRRRLEGQGSGDRLQWGTLSRRHSQRSPMGGQMRLRATMVPSAAPPPDVEERALCPLRAPDRMAAQPGIGTGGSAVQVTFP